MYKIIGADQKEYGPVSADQLRQWIAEGRVNAQTLIQGAGETTWRPISTFPEFASSFSGAPAPFAAPPPMGATPAAHGDSRLRAQQDIAGPAVGLMITAGLGILVEILGIVLDLSGAQAARMNEIYSRFYGQYGQSEEMVRAAQMFAGSTGAIVRGVGILICIFMLYGALKMKKLENYGLSIAVSILAMIPCLSPCLSPCCVIGLPIGIWALVMLNKPGIKMHFT
jgi:hypothetical protein